MIWLRVIGALAVCAALVWGGYRAGADSVQVQWDAEKLRDFAAYNEAMRVAREKEQAMATEAENERKRTSEKINHLQHTADALRAELRKRPARPTPGSVPTAPATEPDARWCTPDRLYSDDAAVAVWFAERAETMKALLAECRTLYEGQ
ncbi:MAG TPA: hypothetical protein VFV43_09085 [Limnobacter sp.]|nr:hypothetical protein [Limnobacter sp.]